MPLPSGCRIRDKPTGGKNCFHLQLDCPHLFFRPQKSSTLGTIVVCKHKRRRRVVYGVQSLFVQPDLRRRGLATALYEAAAAEACRRRGRLASIARAAESGSYAFWQKQAMKGRADHYRWWRVKGQREYIDPEIVGDIMNPLSLSPLYDLFILKDCPAPTDLSGFWR
jgi:GNAT superfamily N-acetyltransferase